MFYTATFFWNLRFYLVAKLDSSPLEYSFRPKELLMMVLRLNHTKPMLASSGAGFRYIEDFYTILQFLTTTVVLRGETEEHRIKHFDKILNISENKKKIHI